MSRSMYLVNHRKSGLVVGDKVRIISKAETHEGGWGDSWIRDMDQYVGKTGTIIKDNDVFGFEVDMGDLECYNFPYFVLQKIESDVDFPQVLVGRDVWKKHAIFSDRKGLDNYCFINGYKRKKYEKIPKYIKYLTNATGYWKIRGRSYMIIEVSKQYAIYKKEQ